MQMILLKKYYNITFFGNCELWTIRPWCRVAALNWPLSFFVDFGWIFPIIKCFFVRDGILSVADYNSTRVGVVVVVVVVRYFFAMG